MKKNVVFALFALAIFSGFFQFYVFLKSHFSGEAGLRHALRKTERLLETERLRVAWAQSDFAEFRNHVAAVLPTTGDLVAQYSTRNIASLSESPLTQDVSIEKGTSLFVRAREAFRSGKYDEAIEGLEVLVLRFPNSVHRVEAQFLLAEALFRTQKVEDSVKEIEQMVELFPESDLTGFALLRLAAIHQSRDENEEAKEIYALIQRQFKSLELREQVEVALRGHYQ